MDGEDRAAIDVRPTGLDVSTTAASIPQTSADRGVVRAVFFDVGETLLRPRRPYGALLAAVGQDLGIDLPAALLNGIVDRIDERVAERTRQGHPFTFPAEVSQQFWHETYHGFFQGHLPTDQAARLAQGLLGELSAPSGYVLFDDVIDTLEELRRHGYHLGVISNWEAWLPALLESSGLARYVDTVVVSGVCRVEKPDPRIFSLALEETGLAPAEAVYVGDRPAHDIIPAQEAGITAILLDRDHRYPDHSGCLRISSLAQLVMMLQTAPSHGYEP